MVQVDVSQSIHIILDGINYPYWVQVFLNFLCDRKLWKNATTHPIATIEESSNKFNAWFEE